MLYYPFNSYMNQRNQNVTQAVEKLKQRNLPVESILDEEDLMNDLKYSNTSQLVNYITKEDMMTLLKYVVKEPEADDHKTGHKYPFQAAELLSGENTYLLDKFFEDSNNEEEEEDVYEQLDEEGPEQKESKEGDNAEKVEKMGVKSEKEGETAEVKVDVEGEAEEVKEESKEPVTVENKDEIKNNKIEGKTEGKAVEKAEEKEPVTPKYDILDYFLSFLDDEDKDLNYVLSGYFAKIFTSLRYNRPAAITRYLFLHKRDYIFKMIKHMNRKGIADSILKILLIDASDLASDIQSDFENHIKYDIINNIMDNFDVSNEEKCENICELLMDAINNRKFAILLLKNVTLVKKINKLILDNYNTLFVKDLLKVIIKLSEIYLKEIKLKVSKDGGSNDGNIMDNFDRPFGGDFDDLMPNKPVENFDIKECIDMMEVFTFDIPSLIKDYVCTENPEENNALIHTTFDKTLQTLGLKNLLIFDYVKNVYEIYTLALSNKVFIDEEKEGADVIVTQRCENLLNLFTICLVENNFFTKSIDNFFCHEWNNSYQKSFDALMEFVLTHAGANNNEATSKLLNNIFIEGKFLDNSIDNCLKMKFVFNSGKQINPGYLPYLLEICYNVMNCNNETMKSILEQFPNWKLFISEFVEPIRTRFSTGLKYDLNQEPISFRDEFSRNIQAQNKPELSETTERNFIDNVRKQANSSITNLTISPSTQESSPTYNEEYNDNTYWKPHLTQEIAELLEEIDLN